ncbi:MAG TPA: response regulator transcription factor [Acidimicrobiales bacterium]|nr:response regulator transcription factor [Acidimicrobiales bacterium]
MSTIPIRVFVVDDHEVVRRGLMDLLDAVDDIEIAGEAGTVEDAIGRIPGSNVDVAVLDVRLPDGTGIDIARAVRERDSTIQCLMLTSFDDEDALLNAILAGASGYLLKQVKGLDLIDAVRRVAAGQSLLDPAVTERVLRAVRNREQRDERLERLTPQEHRIVELLAEGRTNREIGADMFLAEKTVKNYVSNVLAKLGMSQRTEAAVWAARLDERGELHRD